MKVGFRLKIFFLCFLSTATLASPSTDELDNADYLNGKNAFQQRCSACHTLAADSANIVGPNLGRYLAEAWVKIPALITHPQWLRLI